MHYFLISLSHTQEHIHGSRSMVLWEAPISSDTSPIDQCISHCLHFKLSLPHYNRVGIDIISFWQTITPHTWAWFWLFIYFQCKKPMHHTLVKVSRAKSVALQYRYITIIPNIHEEATRISNGNKILLSLLSSCFAFFWINGLIFYNS